MDYKAIDTKKLDYFLESVKEYYPEVPDFREIRSILNLWDNRRWSIRLFILQWHFLGNQANEHRIKEIAQKAVDSTDSAGIIQRFQLPTSNFALDYDFSHPDGRARGEASLPTTVTNLHKKGIIFEKEGNNYYLDPIGTLCANFLFFSFIVCQVPLITLWDLIKLMPTGQNIKSLGLSPGVLKDLFVIEESGEKFQFTEVFQSLLDFLQDYPVLYSEERALITRNFLDILTSAILQRGEQVPLTSSMTPLYRYNGRLEELDWIYSLTPHLSHGTLDFLEWAQSKEIWELKRHSSEILEKYLVIEAPAGYGKSTFLIQECLKMIQSGEVVPGSGKYLLPVIFDAEEFRFEKSRESETLFFNEHQIMDLGPAAQKSPRKSTEDARKAFNNFLRAGLAKYYTVSDLSLRIYRAIVKASTFIFIIDGWDEMQVQVRPYLRKLLESLDQAQVSFKVIFSSRFIDATLRKFTVNEEQVLKGREGKPVVISLDLPTKEMAVRYLSVVTQQAVDEAKIGDLESRLRMPLTPLDLFLLGIFPQFLLPDSRGEMYERWIYFHSLVDYVDKSNLLKVHSLSELRELLDSTQIIREEDGREGSIRDWIEGNILGITSGDTRNYGLFEILPQICYSWFNSQIFGRLNYAFLAVQNPVLRHFLSPYYAEGLQQYAGIQDYHLVPYLLARFIFTSFLNDAPVTPVYHPAVEDFLKDYFNQNARNPIFTQYKISTPEQFLSHLYLRVQLAFPALSLPYHGGPDAVFGVAVSNESIPYGQYLIKAFQFEHDKALQNQNYARLVAVLDLFSEYVKNRPTTTFGFSLDGFTNEMDFEGDPETNRKPATFFEMVYRLLDLPPYSQKSDNEIQFEGGDWASYVPITNLGWTRKYWQKGDYRQILSAMIHSENIHILPWFAEIIDAIPDDQFPEIDVALLSERFRSTSEKLMESAILKILLRSPSFNLHAQFEKVRQKNNPALLDLILGRIYPLPRPSMDDRDFAFWISLYETPFLTFEQRTHLLQELFSMQLFSPQLQILTRLYDHAPDQDTRFRLFCLLAIYECYTFTSHQITDELRFALEKSGDHFENRMFLFALLDQHFARNELSAAFHELDFFDAFATSPEILAKDTMASDEEKTVLDRAHALLSSLQESWWEDNCPSTLEEIRALLQQCFTHADRHESISTYHTSEWFDSDRPTRETYVYPPICKLLPLLGAFEDAQVGIASELFAIIREQYIEGKKQPPQDAHGFNPVFSSNPQFIQDFLRWASTKIPAAMKVEWLHSFVPSTWDYTSYSCLFEGLDVPEDLRALIRSTIGEGWITESNDLPYRRESRPLNSNSALLAAYLPFEELERQLQARFEWDKVYTRNLKSLGQILPQGVDPTKVGEINQLGQLGALNHDQKQQIKETSRAFLLPFYNYVQSLSAIGSSDAIRIIASLWARFYLLPLVPQEFHPSYIIFHAASRDILLQVARTLPDSPPKVFLLLGLIQTERYFAGKHRIVGDLVSIDPDIIASSVEQLYGTDWGQSSKDLLLLFASYSERLIPPIISFIKANPLRDYGFALHPNVSTPSFEWVFGADFCISHNVTKIHLPEPRFLAAQYLFRYAFLTALLNHEKVTPEYLRALPLADFDENPSFVLESLAGLPAKQVGHPYVTLDINQLTNEFSTRRQAYMDAVHMIEEGPASRDPLGGPAFQDKLNFLNYFRTLPPEPERPPRDDLPQFEKDAFLQELARGTLEGTKVLDELHATQYGPHLPLLLKHILPTPAPTGEMADDWDPPKLVEKYQPTVFWLHFMRYGRERSRWLTNLLQDSVYYAIAQDKWMTWLEQQPADLTPGQVALVDHLALSVTFFESQIPQLPENLREIAGKLTWRYWLFPTCRNACNELHHNVCWYLGLPEGE